ncbi:MAG: hypothetical protein ABIF01_05505 [Candidatus Micrarchaeota archaeon]
MSSAKFAQNVDALSKNRQELSGIIQTLNYRKGFKDITTSLKLNLKSSSLASVSNTLWTARSEVVESTPDLKIKKHKKDKQVLARAELSELASAAMELSYKEGKLHKGGNFKDLRRLKERIENAENQLAQANPEAAKALAKARGMVENDIAKFSKAAFDALKADMGALISALGEIQKGATSFSWSPFSGFKDKSMHRQTIAMIPKIIDALNSEANAELLSGQPKSLSEAVGTAMHLVTAVNDTLSEMSSLDARLEKLDVKASDLDKSALPSGSIVAFLSTKEPDEETGPKVVELNIALEQKGLKVSGGSNSGSHRTSGTGILKGDYWWGSVQTTKEMTREEAKSLIAEAKAQISSKGFGVTVTDFKPPKDHVKKGLLKEEKPKVLSMNEKAKLVLKVEADYQKLQKKWNGIVSEIDKAKTTNPIVWKLLLTEPSSEHCPKQLVQNAVEYMGDEIKKRKVEVGLSPPTHHPDYKQPEKVSGGGADGT